MDIIGGVIGPAFEAAFSNLTWIETKTITSSHEGEKSAALAATWKLAILSYAYTIYHSSTIQSYSDTTLIGSGATIFGSTNASAWVKVTISALSVYGQNATTSGTATATIMTFKG